MKITPELLASLSASEREELDRLLSSGPPWQPLPGPQEMAYRSEATVVGFGGAAGGGKTDLAVGLSITQHRRIGIFRQNGTELTGVVDRLTELLGGRDGWNGAERIWRITRYDGVPAQIELGSFPAPDEERKYQGRPHDLLVFDEASNMREAAVRFLMGWLRTTDQGQRCRVVMTFNPPTTAEGRWVIAYFAPWLDPKYPRPAQPGEVRWFATLDGRDVEVDEGKPFYVGGELVMPQSRTFIPSRITDNPYLLNTGYMSQLQSLPEPLRSQMLYGDFLAGVQDDPWQVIPTEWVEQAQRRWTDPVPKPPMDSVGVDVARGGQDETVIARRHGMWFDEPLVYPGKQTPDGPSVAGLVVAALRDQAPIHIDVIGVGSSPYDFLLSAGMQVYGVNVAEAAKGLDRSGRLRFKNLRSELWWRMREALDPANNTGIALPRNPRLLADLTAPTWRMAGATVSVDSREDIYRRLGRSPDYASAFCLALIDSPKMREIESRYGTRQKREHDPYRDLDLKHAWKP
jgi:hypothetical protein